jgi:hypothetical protein
MRIPGSLSEKLCRHRRYCLQCGTADKTATQAEHGKTSANDTKMGSNGSLQWINSSRQPGISVQESQMQMHDFIRMLQGSKPLNVVQHVEWIDHQRQFNSINIKLDYLIAQSILMPS